MTSTAVVDRLGVQVGEVVARHERSLDIADFGKYEDDPGGFFRDVLRCYADFPGDRADQAESGSNSSQQKETEPSRSQAKICAKV